MEPENTVWLIGLIALTAGILIGALGYRLFAPSVKEADKIKSELSDAREELDKYKAGVTQHFDRTAELVNDLAQNYVKVYQHLAEGAQTLGASKSFKDLMEQHQGKASIAVDDQSKVTEIEHEDLAVEPVDVQEESENETAESHETDVSESSGDHNEPSKNIT
ncbi:MAG: DUF1043 family protein [Gammaproteobacteria bacterium]|nr:DUF1043 family protein [Gammaproteobacteria bacterium]